MKRTIFADLETVTKNTKYFKKHNDTTLHFGYLEPSDSDDGYVFKTFDEMFEWLKNYGKSCIVYFHNLSFDGDFITKWLTTHNYKWVNLKDVKKPYQFGSLRDVSDIYSIKVCMKDKSRNKIYVEFRCSFRLLSASIEDLGKDLGVLKYEKKNMTLKDKNEFYDVEFEKEIDNYDKNFIDYCKRDVRIQKQSVLNFNSEFISFLKNPKNMFKNYFHGFDWQKHYTIGGIAVEIQKRYLKKFPKIYQGLYCSEDSARLADKFYFGGFTQFNPELQMIELNDIKKGVCIDINSSYPNSMLDELPYGECFRATTSLEIPKNNVLIFYKIRVGLAVAKYKNFPCLWNWIKKDKDKFGLFTKLELKFRYVTDLQNFVCYYWKDEWECLQKFYDFYDVEILETYWMNSSKYLRQYILDTYQFKEEHSRNKQKALAHTYKILLNSSYGKHAQRSNFKALFLCDSKEMKDQLIDKQLTLGNRLYNMCECSENIKMVENCFPLWGKPVDEYTNKNHNKWITTIITARSRMKLYNMIYEMGVENFIYCDTDSIFFQNVDESKYAKYLDDYKIGMWKKEYEIVNGFVKGPKAYMFQKDDGSWVKKHSGINKQWVKENLNIETMENIQQVYEKAKLVEYHYKSGIILESIDYHSNPRYH